MAFLLREMEELDAQPARRIVDPIVAPKAVWADTWCPLEDAPALEGGPLWEELAQLASHHIDRLAGGLGEHPCQRAIEELVLEVARVAWALLREEAVEEATRAEGILGQSIYGQALVRFRVRWNGPRRHIGPRSVASAPALQSRGGDAAVGLEQHQIGRGPQLLVLPAHRPAQRDPFCPRHRCEEEVAGRTLGLLFAQREQADRNVIRHVSKRTLA